MLLEGMTGDTNALESFRAKCAERKKDPLKAACELATLVRAYSDKLADLGLVDDAKVLIPHEVRWRVTYAVLAGSAVTCEADMPEVMRIPEGGGGVVNHQSQDPEIWTATGGRQLKIVEMDDFHILNVIGFLRRRAQDYAQKHGVDQEALLNRIPQYSRLLSEVASRGLAVSRSNEAKATYERFGGLIMNGGDE